MKVTSLSSECMSSPRSSPPLYRTENEWCCELLKVMILRIMSLSCSGERVVQQMKWFSRRSVSGKRVNRENERSSRKVVQENEWFRVSM